MNNNLTIINVTLMTEKKNFVTLQTNIYQWLQCNE